MIGAVLRPVEVACAQVLMPLLVPVIELVATIAGALDRTWGPLPAAPMSARVMSR